MKTSKNRSTLLSLAALVALSACGGGGGGSSPTTAEPGTTVSGKAVDGYINGATIFCDANGDRLVSNGEVSTTTNGSGSFTLPSPCSSTVVAVGGVDIDTEYAFSGLLSAPAGSTVVTPITTLLANSSLTNAELLESLNLPADLNLTQTDPMTNFALWRKNLAVQQVLQQMSYFFTSYVTQNTLLYAQAAQLLAQAMQASSTPLFDATGNVNQAILTSAVQDMADALNVSPSDDDISTVVSTLAQQSSAYLVASNGTTLVNIAKDLQNPAKPPIQTPTAQTNYLALTNDTFHVNGQAYTLSDLTAAGGITVSGLDTLRLEYTAHGTVDLNHVVNLAVSISEVGGSGRILQAKVEQLRIQRDHDSGTITVSPTPDTVVYAYVRDQNGISVNASLDGSDFSPLSGSVDSLTIDYAKLIDRAANHPQVPANFDKNQFLNLQGSFDVKAVVTHNLNARRDNGETLPTVNVGIYNTHYGVTGYGVAGRVNIQ